MGTQIIKLEEARSIVHSTVTTMPHKQVLLPDALGYTLAEDIYSDINIPPFDKSAMDGFACRFEDLNQELEIIETIPAGTFPEKTVGINECARIMTGAAIPQGADTVIMVEHIEHTTSNRIKFTKEKTNRNICKCGEDVMLGDLILAIGTKIAPEHIAILASAGKSEVRVYNKPSTGIMVSGSELVEPNQELPPQGKIRNGNGHQMVAQLRKDNYPVKYLGIVEDDRLIIKNRIAEALNSVDVLFLSGGVSVGDYDYIPEIINELGFTTYFHTLATKPGKHTLFAAKNGKYILGFPGNPVSSFVQLELLGKYLLDCLMNTTHKELRFMLPVGETIARKRSDRHEFLPVQINHSGTVNKLPYNGSAHIHAIAMCNALLEIPIGVNILEEGEMAYVRPL